MKTKRAAAKRFKRTGAGKLVHHSQAQNHLAATKNARRMRRLKRAKTLETGDLRTVETLLPYK
ncbi:MAG: 50S ribosomal protein L35 [Armatimonadota bacterium]